MTEGNDASHHVMLFQLTRTAARRSTAWVCQQFILPAVTMPYNTRAKTTNQTHGWTTLRKVRRGLTTLNKWERKTSNFSSETECCCLAVISLLFLDVGGFCVYASQTLSSRMENPCFGTCWLISNWPATILQKPAWTPWDSMIKW